jgi:hypothetical protein
MEAGLQQYGRWIGYLDETGDPYLANVDKDYPVFGVSLCMFDKAVYAASVVPRMLDLKFKWWGHDMVVLHEAELRRREKPFVFLGDPSVRDSFMADLDNLIQQAPMTLFAAVIRKQFYASNGKEGDLYSVALRFILERVASKLRQRHAGSLRQQLDAMDPFILVAEMRGQKEDAELELAFRRICAGQNYRGERWPFELCFASKKANSTGLQIADLTARPIALSVLRPNQPNRAYELLAPKFHRSPDGQIDGWGLKVFPKP